MEKLIESMQEHQQDSEVWPNAIPLYESTIDKTPDENTGTINVKAEYFDHVTRQKGTEPRWYMNPEEFNEQGINSLYEVYDVQTRQIQLAKRIRVDDSQAKMNKYEIAEKEAKIMDRASRITHQVPKIYDLVENNGDLYFIMEKIDGLDINKYIVENNLDINQTLNLVIDIATAVDKLVKSNIFHRDLKTENFVVDKYGTPFITDFGTSNKVLPEDKIGAGTWGYMAPELLHGGLASEKTEMYSLGITTKELISITNNENELPENIRGVLNKATAEKPEDRYETLEDFINALKEAQEFNKI